MNNNDEKKPDFKGPGQWRSQAVAAQAAAAKEEEREDRESGDQGGATD